MYVGLMLLRHSGIMFFSSRIKLLLPYIIILKKVIMLKEVGFLLTSMIYGPVGI